MSYNDIVQAIADASKDADTLEQVINGEAETQVKSRLGRMVYTLSTISSRINNLTNQANQKLTELQDAINTAAAAGAGANGWTPQLIALPHGRNQHQKNLESLTPFDFGAVGDGQSHKLSTKYATLADAQKVYPHAQALTDEIDWCAITAILEKIKTFDTVIYSASKIVLSGIWQINKPLRFETNGFIPTNFTVPTIEMNCKLLLDNFAIGQECVVFVGGSAFNFIGNLSFDVARKAKYGLLSRNSDYANVDYFPKCTNLPRCFIDNAVLYNVGLINSMFAILPAYRGQGAGSGSLFYKDVATLTNNTVMGEGTLGSTSIITVDKLPDVAIDNEEHVIVKVGEYYSVAKSVTGKDITVRPHIPQSAGTEVLYIYGAGLYIDGGNSAGVTIGTFSSLDSVGIHMRGLFTCIAHYMCTEFTAISFRDDSVVGGMDIGVAYYEGDGAQYVKTNLNSSTFGGTTIRKSTGMEIDKHHDLSLGRKANGKPTAELQALSNVRISEKGRDLQSSIYKRSNNYIPNATLLDFNRVQQTEYVLSNSRTIFIANIIPKYNELFGFDSQEIVVVGTGPNGAPNAVGFAPPEDGVYTVNGSTTEVIFKDFASAAVFECIVDIANKNILISLVSRAASTQSPVPSSVTNTADLPVNTFYYFDVGSITDLPTPSASASVGNIKTYYSYGNANTAHIKTQHVEFPEIFETWERNYYSSTGTYGEWKRTKTPTV